MTVIITTNEPKKVRQLFDDKLEIPMGFDMMLLTNSGRIGIERKKVPGDLLSSVADGRLNKEILAMREETQIQVLLLHGIIRYHEDGKLKVWGKRPGRDWTKKGITNLLRTIQYVEGVYVETAANNRELVEVVHDLQEYFDKGSHTSLKSRPRIQTDWIVPTHGEKVIYFYNGLPGVGITGAKKLYDRFPAPLQLYGASVDEIMKIPRVGRVMAQGIYQFLREA